MEQVCFRSRLIRFAGLRGRALTGRRAVALASAYASGLFSLTAVPASGGACAGARHKARRPFGLASAAPR